MPQRHSLFLQEKMLFIHILIYLIASIFFYNATFIFSYWILFNILAILYGMIKEAQIKFFPRVIISFYCFVLAEVAYFIYLLSKNKLVSPLEIVNFTHIIMLFCGVLIFFTSKTLKTIVLIIEQEEIIETLIL